MLSGPKGDQKYWCSVSYRILSGPKGDQNVSEILMQCFLQTAEHFQNMADFSKSLHFLKILILTDIFFSCKYCGFFRLFTVLMMINDQHQNILKLFAESEKAKMPKMKLQTQKKNIIVAALSFCYSTEPGLWISKRQFEIYLLPSSYILGNL